MEDAETYRRLAADCRAKARQAAGEVRTGYLALAAQYDRLADAAESANSGKDPASPSRAP